jgi:Putative zinc-finger
MFSCKRAGELISLSLESELSLSQRLALAVHLFACPMCRLFRRQLQWVEQACRKWARLDRASESAAVLLAPEARERIGRSVHQALTAR